MMSPRSAGAAVVFAGFALAVAESQLQLDADRVAPLWDKIVHAAAGAGLVLLVSPRPTARRRAVLGAVGLGLAWELAQVLVDPIASRADTGGYYLDTATDLVADALGALATAYPRSGRLGRVVRRSEGALRSWGRRDRHAAGLDGGQR